MIDGPAADSPRAGLVRAPARPSPSLVISFLALAFALSGTAVAANLVTSKEIKRNAVRAKHVKQDAVRTAEIKDGGVLNADLGQDAVDGSKVAASSLDDSDLADYEVLGGSLVRVEATEAGSEAAAQDAAPEVPLFSKGQAAIYAKCFRDSTAGATFGEIYARTDENGAILEGGDVFPDDGATLLNTGTPEEASELDVESVTSPNTGDVSENEGVVHTPDGTAVVTATGIAVKQGDLGGGNGAFGPGNVCLFGGAISG